MKWLVSALFFALCSLGATAQDETSGATLRDEVARAERNLSDLQGELARAKAVLEQRRAQLEELSISGINKVSVEALNNAQADLATREARAASLRTRLLSRRSVLGQIEELVALVTVRIEELRSELARLQAEYQAVQSEGARAELSRRIAEQQQALKQTVEKQSLLTRSRETVAATIPVLDELQTAANRQAAVARHQLELLQSQFELPNLAELTTIDRRTLLRVRREIDELLRTATRLRAQAVELEATDPTAVHERRLLETQVLAAEEKAELRALALDLDGIEVGLRRLEEFISSPSTTRRALQQARQSVRALETQLADAEDLLSRKSRLINDQLRIIEELSMGESPSAEARVALLDELRAELGALQEQTRSRAEAANTLGQRFETAVQSGARAALYQKLALPDDLEEWKRLLVSLQRLPGQIFRFLSSSVRLVFARLSDASTQVYLYGLISLIVIVGLLGGLRATQARLRAAKMPSRTLLVVTQVLRTLLVTFAPATLLFVIFWQLDIPRDIRKALLSFAVFPAALFVFRTSLVTLLRRFVPDRKPGSLRRFQRVTTATLWPVAFIAIFFVVAHQAAVDPGVLAALGRASFVCLLLLAIPVLYLRSLIDVRSQPKRRVVLQIAGIGLPVSLMICAGIGFAGYVALGYALAELLGWVSLILFGYLLLRGWLEDLRLRAVRAVSRRGVERAPFYQQNLIEPGFRLITTLLTVAALIGCGLVVATLAQTPVFENLRGLLSQPLLRFGESTLRVSGVVLAVGIAIAAIWAAGWARRMSFEFAYRRIEDIGIRNSLATFTQYVVVLIGFLIAVRTIGLDLTALAVFAGALGVGVGFGMQQIVNNFISGILLLIERPLAVNDIVNVDKYEGEVTQIGIRSITVKTWNAEEVIIPNSAVITQPFTNWTRSDDILRMVLYVGISYGDDPHHARDAILDVLRQNHAVLSFPEPKVLLWEFGDSAIQLWVQFHSRLFGPVGRLDMRSQVLFAIWDRFKEVGITIPFPQRDIHLRGEQPPFVEQ